MAHYTKKDIQIIAEHMRDNPTALLTGAGCSYSAGIPLASEIINEIAKKVPSLYSTLSDHEKNDYGACMAILTPQQRSAMFSKMLNNARINWAHIAMATMINAGFISRILTFNFDNILARACGLVGLYPPTYDLASTKTLELKYIAPKAIIHLHGQGHGMIKLNTTTETSEHAEVIKQIIKDTISKNSLIVIGYSGKSDAAFHELINEHHGENRIYWCDYDDEPNTDINKIFASGNYAEHLGKCDADKFLIELAIELGCFPPKIFWDPHEYILDQLEPIEEIEEITNGIVSNLRTQMKDLQSETISELNKFLLQKNWQQVLKKGNKNNPTHKRSISWAYSMQGSEIQNEAKDKKDKALFITAIEQYKTSILASENFYQGYNNLGIACTNYGRMFNDKTKIDEGMAAYKKAIDIKNDFFEAWHNWGFELLSEAYKNPSKELLNETIIKLQTALSLSRRQKTLFNLADALSILAELEKNESLFEQAFLNYKESFDQDNNDTKVLLNWGISIVKLAEIKNDDQLFKEGLEKLEKASTPPPPIEPEKYFLAWGNALRILGNMKNDGTTLAQAKEKLKTAIEFNSNSHESLLSYGSCLLEIYEINRMDSSLKEIEEILSQAEKINPDDVYSMACCYARQNRLSDCKEKLFHCKQKGTLPKNPKQHLLKDKDMENVRSLDWFSDFIADLE